MKGRLRPAREASWRAQRQLRRVAGSEGRRARAEGACANRQGDSFDVDIARFQLEAPYTIH
jgi:hypothetical protein